MGSLNTPQRPQERVEENAYGEARVNPRAARADAHGMTFKMKGALRQLMTKKTESAVDDARRTDKPMRQQKGRCEREPYKAERKSSERCPDKEGRARRTSRHSLRDIFINRRVHKWSFNLRTKRRNTELGFADLKSNHCVRAAFNMHRIDEAYVL